MTSSGVSPPLASGAPASARSGAVAVAAAARTCPPPPYPGVGYFTSLSASGTTCKTATKLVLATYKCRTKSGPAGKCGKVELGFKCTESRISAPDEIDASDKCAHGHAKVVSTWQQDIS
jgi:hypothetical protein